MADRMAVADSDWLARSAVLYRFFDVADGLLYIGITAVGVARWTQHSAEQPWWPSLAWVTVEHFVSVELAETAERRAILAEHPAFNVIHRHVARPRLRGRPRRPHGAGSLFLRADGLWVAQVTAGPRGTRRVVRRYSRDRDRAEQALVALLDTVV